MSELRELYQSVILDHHKKPRNFGKPDSCTHRADGHNPLCGDKVTVFMTVENDVVKDVRFEGSGCAISTASASMMTESIRGKSIAEAEKIFQAFHQLITAEEPTGQELLGKLAVFGGVREFPLRAKCATLAWHTVHAALTNGETATTE